MVASDLERIAARLRALAADTERHRSELPRIANGLRQAAGVVGHQGGHATPHRPGAPSPQDVIGALMHVANGAPDAMAKLKVASDKLAAFAASLTTSVTSSPGARPSTECPPAPTSGRSANGAKPSPTDKSDTTAKPDPKSSEKDTPQPRETGVDKAVDSANSAGTAAKDTAVPAAKDPAGTAAKTMSSQAPASSGKPPDHDKTPDPDAATGRDKPDRPRSRWWSDSSPGKSRGPKPPAEHRPWPDHAKPAKQPPAAKPNDTTDDAGAVEAD